MHPAVGLDAKGVKATALEADLRMKILEAIIRFWV